VTDLETRDVKAFRHPGSSQRKQAKPRNQREGEWDRQPGTNGRHRSDALMLERGQVYIAGGSCERKAKVAIVSKRLLDLFFFALVVFFWGGGFHAINPPLSPVPSAD
jgi:hypothetical protein